MILHYTNPGQSPEYVIDGVDYDLSLTLENDIGDGITIFSEVNHIRMGARVRAVSDAGDVLFVGVVVSIEYGASGGKRRYNCIAAEALLQCRQAPNLIYPGDTGLVLSDIFSSDAPPQAAGDNQYCMGLLWLSRSKICDGPDSGIVSWDSDGVGTLTGWGPLVAGCDIYYGGHLLAESTLSAITGGTYRYAISGDNLYVRGAGTGAIYDVIAADGWTENHVRLGTVATDSEIDAPYDVTETDIWGLIRDLVSETGQHVIFRRSGDYVYLDISATPKARGSEAEPFASLHVGDDFSLQKISAPRYLPYACVVGMGAGAENIEGVRYVRGDLLSPGQAWLETAYQLEDARLPPWGHLDQATDDFFDAIHQDPPVEVVLYRDGFLPGDWLELDLGAGNKAVGQIRQITKSSSGYDVATVGAPDLSLLTAFLERSETVAIEGYRDKIRGEYSDSDDATAEWYRDVDMDPRTIWEYDGCIYVYSYQYDRVLIYNSSNLIRTGFLECSTNLTTRSQVQTDGTNIFICLDSDIKIYKYDMNLSFVASSASLYVDFDLFGDYIYACHGELAYKLNKSLSVVVTSGSFKTGVGEPGSESITMYGICTNGSNIFLHLLHAYYSSGWKFNRELVKCDMSFNIISRQVISSSGGCLMYYNGWLLIYNYANATVRKYSTALAYIGDYMTDRDGYICTDGTYIYTTESDTTLEKLNTSAEVVGSTDDMWIETYWSADPFTMAFTPDDFEGADGLILFSLSWSGASMPENPDARVTCLVHVNGVQFCIIHGCEFYPSPITDLDISAACDLDGTEETVTVYMKWGYDIEETGEFTGTVRGIKKP